MTHLPRDVGIDGQLAAARRVFSGVGPIDRSSPRGCRAGGAPGPAASAALGGRPAIAAVRRAAASASNRAPDPRPFRHDPAQLADLDALALVAQQGQTDPLAPDIAQFDVHRTNPRRRTTGAPE